MKRILKPKIIIALSVAFLFLITILQNTQVVSIQFLFWKLSMSRAILLPLLVVFGFCSGYFVGRKRIF